MLQHTEIRSVKETPGMHAAGFHTQESPKIEEVLRRAREIHRRHGGVFGYDFEDWAEAWRELPQSTNTPEMQFAAGDGAELLSELEEVCE